MRTRVPRSLYALLFAYIAVTLAWQLTASVSLIAGYFDLRHQVQDQGLVFDTYTPVIRSAATQA